MRTFAICIEASHKMGMGHLFRALNMAKFTRSKEDKCIILVNDDKAVLRVLDRKQMIFDTVSLKDFYSGWEGKIITRHKIDVWINDRLDTDARHAKNVKKNNITLISLDDRGSGAEIADINFGSLPCNFEKDLKGKKVLKGLDYLILDSRIDEFKRERRFVERVLVTLGGSDTYGLTIKVVEILKKAGIKADIIAGPGFKHFKELKSIINEDYTVIKDLPSLIKKFHDYDLAITSGGITPFEANASGLPCIIVAAEQHEVENGLFLEKLGSSFFAGFRDEMKPETLTYKTCIENLSKKGMESIKTSGAENVYREITSL